MHCVAIGGSDLRAYERFNSEIVLRRNLMAKGFVLWLLGIPFGLIVILWLFGFLS
jgi:hypothetical protein